MMISHKEARGALADLRNYRGKFEQMIKDQAYQTLKCYIIQQQYNNLPALLKEKPNVPHTTAQDSSDS